MISAILANPLGLIAALSPLIIKSVDNNRARIDQASKLRDAELKNANDLASELMAATDRILFLNKEALYGVVFRGLTVESVAGKTASDADLKAWETLQAESALWNSSKTSRLARIYGTFDDQTVRLFSGLSMQLGLLENMVDAAFYMRTRSRYFIKDTEAKKTGPNQDDQIGEDFASQPRHKVDFVIETLGIDTSLWPDLAETIQEFGSGKPAPKSRQMDFRYKYFPVYNNSQKELFAIGARMLSQIQNEQVGALRKVQPVLVSARPAGHSTTKLHRKKVAQQANAVAGA